MAQRDITFKCAGCKFQWTGAFDRAEALPDDQKHGFDYFANCPKCGSESSQIYWERNAFRAWASATGARTEEGKKASAANLVGHPTPQEALLTRFNALKHGMRAETATYFPARPGKYDACKTCEHNQDEGGRAYCRAQSACVQKVSLFMQHHAAFDQRSPDALRGIYANFQGGIFAMVSDMLRRVIEDGALLSEPKVVPDASGRGVVVMYTDEDGQTRTLTEKVPHPLLKPLAEFISRVNLSLSDMGMTTKVVEQHDDGMGSLTPDNKQTLMADFMQKQLQQNSGLQALLGRAKEDRDNDPVLAAHSKQLTVQRGAK